MSTLYKWEKYSITSEWEIEKTSVGTTKPSDCSGSLKKEYSIDSDGCFVLSGSTYLSGYYYVNGQTTNAKSIYYASWSPNISGANNTKTTYYLWTLTGNRTEKKEFIEEVSSPNKSAYPLSGMQGDYYYEYIGSEIVDETEGGTVENSGWTEPKINWTKDDYFVTENENAYNRIVGNLSYLKNLAKELFAGIEDFPVGEEKTNLCLIYAREMNYIENGLEIINSRTYKLDIGEKQVFKPNGKTPLWTELNRIENACLTLYKMLTIHKKILPRLSITLGGEKGIKV